MKTLSLTIIGAMIGLSVSFANAQTVNGYAEGYTNPFVEAARKAAAKREATQGSQPDVQTFDSRQDSLRGENLRGGTVPRGTTGDIGDSAVTGGSSNYADGVNNPFIEAGKQGAIDKETSTVQKKVIDPDFLKLFGERPSYSKCRSENKSLGTQAASKACSKISDKQNSWDQKLRNWGGLATQEVRAYHPEYFDKVLLGAYKSWDFAGVEFYRFKANNTGKITIKGAVVTKTIGILAGLSAESVFKDVGTTVAVSQVKIAREGVHQEWCHATLIYNNVCLEPVQFKMADVNYGPYNGKAASEVIESIVPKENPFAFYANFNSYIASLENK